MPRLAARQWHTLRGARPAVRAYSQQTTPPATPIRTVLPRNSAIIIPSSVNVHPDRLIDQIPNIPPELVARDRFCVLLVTPSFAPWLVNDDVFLARALHRAYGLQQSVGGRTGRHTIQALCAVVDRLPAGRAFTRGATLDDEVAQRSLQPPVGQAGYEGIAFAALPSLCSIPSQSPRSSEKGAIDFTVSGNASEGGIYTDTLRLPLANTVFQTGTPSTMHLSTWTLLPEQRSLGLESKVDVSHHGVSVIGSDSRSGHSLSALSIPLLPLTLPRQVEGCMGNIIRRVAGPENETVTASSELEKVVPLFFKSRGEPPQPTTAWALVIPKALTQEIKGQTLRDLSKRLTKQEQGQNIHVTLWERLWRSDPTEWNKIVPYALAEGARLHRVLSGGGGWGKKAGLLSLDPVPVSEEVPIRMEDATSGFDGPGAFSSALTPVVEDGDTIQFFISPTKSAAEQDELKTLKATPKNNTWGWELGTVPSTIDSIPGGSWQHTADSNYIAVFKHSFGALAENGLTLTRHFQVTPHQPSSTLAMTTIDVPYSRFWSVELAGKESSTEDSWQRDSKEMHLRAMTTPRRFVVRTVVDHGRQYKNFDSEVARGVAFRIDKDIERLVRLCNEVLQRITWIPEFRLGAPGKFSLSLDSTTTYDKTVSVVEQMQRSENDSKEFHLRATSAPRVRLTSPVVVRRVNLKEALPMEVFFNDRFFDIKRRIERCIKEQRSIMGVIKNRQHGNLSYRTAGREPSLDSKRPAEKTKSGIEQRPQSTDKSHKVAGAVRPRASSHIQNFARPFFASKKVGADSSPVREKVAQSRRGSDEVAGDAKQRARIRTSTSARHSVVPTKASDNSPPTRLSNYTVKPLRASGVVAERVRRLVSEVSGLTAEYRSIAFDIRRRQRKSSRPLPNVLPEQRAATRKKQQLRTPSSLNQWAWFSDAANNSAGAIYSLHVALRLRIGKMIFERRKKRLGIRRLEARLLELRAFDQVLFRNSPQWWQQRIRARLRKRELTNPVQRSLALDTPLGIPERRLRLEGLRRGLRRELLESPSAANESAASEPSEIRQVRQRARRTQRTRKDVHGPPKLRGYVTVPPYWARKDHNVFRPHHMFTKRRVLAPPRPWRSRSKSRKTKSGGKSMADTVGSWLFGGGT